MWKKLTPYATIKYGEMCVSHFFLHEGISKIKETTHTNYRLQGKKHDSRYIINW